MILFWVREQPRDGWGDGRRAESGSTATACANFLVPPGRVVVAAAVGRQVALPLHCFIACVWVARPSRSHAAKEKRDTHDGGESYPYCQLIGPAMVGKWPNCPPSSNRWCVWPGQWGPVICELDPGLQQIAYGNHLGQAQWQGHRHLMDCHIVFSDDMVPNKWKGEDRKVMVMTPGRHRYQCSRPSIESP
jgi:hypothetical protein